MTNADVHIPPLHPLHPHSPVDPSLVISYFPFQYDDSNASEDEETGPITGISAGDVVIPVEFPPAELIPGTLTLQPAALTVRRYSILDDI